MENKEKTKKYRKRKDLHLRLFIVLFLFLLEMIIIISALTLLLIVDWGELYFLILVSIITTLNYVLGLFVINTKVQVDFKLSWVTVMLTVPFFGAVFYLMFAHKTTTKRRKRLQNNRISLYLDEHHEDKSDVLNEVKEYNADAWSIAKYIDNCGYPIFKNSKFDYYVSGEEGWPVILEELKKAKKYIFFEYFIIEDGKMYDSIYEILKAKAKEGVKVYMLYDDFGSALKVTSYYYKKVRKDGIVCYPFSRISPALQMRQNSRDHRKILVIDGVRAFTGGCNLADEYINEIKRFGYWKDNIVRIKGEAVNNFVKAFIVNLSIASRKDKIALNYDEYKYETNKEFLSEDFSSNQNFVQPYADVPFDNEDVSRNVYLKMINLAKKYVYISTPYLIPDSELVTALINAAKSGVNVTIVTPGIPDKKLIYQVTKSYYAQLILSGVHIVEYTPGFNHEKTMVVDDVMTLTGTCNFEFRSLYLHFEDGVFISNDKEIIKIRKNLETMIKAGKEQELNKYLNVSFPRKFLWSILRIISPLL